MKKRRQTSARSPMFGRSSHFSRRRPGGRPGGLALLRVAFAVAAVASVGALVLLSLRVSVSPRLAPVFRWLPESARGLVEHAPLPTDKRNRLQSLLAETSADFAPMSHLFATHPFAFESNRDAGQRAADAMALLARSKARQSVALVPDDEALLSIVETVDDLTGTSVRRDVLILLPGERVRLSFPADTKGTQSLEFRLGCLAATADRLDAPAKGAVTLASSEERTFEVSPRGEKAVVTLEGKAGDSVSLHWPSSSPGFLVVEGWRDAATKAPTLGEGKRGLLVFTIDSVSGSDMSADVLPKTHAALRSAYGEGNTAEFLRVMPDTVDPEGALVAFFDVSDGADDASKGGIRSLPSDDPQASVTLDVKQNAVATRARQTLFTLATQGGFPAFETRIVPADRECPQGLAPCAPRGSEGAFRVPVGEGANALPETTTAKNALSTADTTLAPDASSSAPPTSPNVRWTMGLGGRPLTSVTFPRHGEIRHAVYEALEAQDLTRPVFAHVHLRFPDDALAPTWQSARASGVGALPGRVLAGLAHALGIPAGRAAARAEKAAQVDDALSRFVSGGRLLEKHDFALIVLRRDAKGDPRVRLPAPPDPGVLWFASRAWRGAAPRVESLTALDDVSRAFASAMRGEGAQKDVADASERGDAKSLSPVERLKVLSEREAAHTVTEGPEGTWHLFPYGKVLVPRDTRRPSSDGAAAHAGSPLVEPRARSVWDVPLVRARETRQAMQERKASSKEHVIHFFFPPTGVQERVSASLQWPLDPSFCSEIDSPRLEGSAGKTSPARGVVEKAEKTDRGLSGGYRIWLTAVADPQRGAHLACAFTGNARPSAEVEMHFERGSQSLALARVGLGEFALPLPEGQEGVQLAQARYDVVAGLLGADFAPSWTAFEGYGVHLWEDPNPRLALSGETPLALRRKDKETEEQKRLEESNRTSGARFAEDRP